MSSPHSSPIAIVGMACRFPGAADSPSMLWSNILNKIDCIEPIPESRWRGEILGQLETSAETDFARVGGFVHDIEDFDAAFFGISPREAVEIDPQQRILLELAWRCMEDAAISAQKLRVVKTGVYVGVINHDHERLILSDQTGISAHSGLGRSTSIASNRISYCFDLSGPSLTIDTACSSSLTAVDAACNALRSGEVDAAFAGGANAILLPESYIEFSRASMLSKLGRCMTFDKQADGFVRAEGGGLVLMKRLSDALLNGDRIYATIVASALNQDGRTTGMMAPNLNAQMKMMKEALQAAGVAASDIGYIESHGTGTQVGDLVEATALGEIYGQAARNGSCPVGSVKTNIGHTEAAAGIAGLIKAVLAVSHGRIPPNLNFITPNPDIEFDSLGIHVPTAEISWQTEPAAPRIAAVNSFGFGGANAHVIVQQQPRRIDQSGDNLDRPLLLPVTAPSQSGIDQLDKDISQAIDNKEGDYPRLCHTAGRRPHMSFRNILTVNGNSDNNYDDPLRQFKGLKQHARLASEQPPLIAFVFNGIGAGQCETGQELYDGEPIFRATIDLCDTIFQNLFDISTLRDFFKNKASLSQSDVVHAHVVHFALQMSLCVLWQSWGVRPKAVIGHSVGEIAAACASGSIDLADAARVVAERAKILQRLKGEGLMLAAGIPFNEALELIDSSPHEAYIAADNSRSSVTLSGTSSSIETLRSRLEERNRFVRVLALPVPFHSPLILPCKSEILSNIRKAVSTEPKIRWFSSVNGKEIRTGVDSTFWWDNFYRPVQFADCMRASIQTGIKTFLEIGPHPFLSHSISEHINDEKIHGQCLFSVKRNGCDASTMRSAAAELFVLGTDLDWQKINPVAEVCDFPQTQLERSRYRHLGPINHSGNNSSSSHHQGTAATGPDSACSRNVRLDVNNWNWLNRHRINGRVTFPAAGYIKLMIDAAVEQTAGTAIELNNIRFRKLLELSDSADCNQSLHVSVSDKPAIGQFSCDILQSSETNSQNIIYADAHFTTIRSRRPHIDPKKINAQCTEDFAVDEIERKLSRFGLDGNYAAWSFTFCRKINDMEVLIKLTGTDNSRQFARSPDPTMLDMCFRASVMFSDMRQLHVPEKIGRFQYWGGVSDSVYCHIKLNSISDRTFELDMNIVDEHGLLIATVSQLILHELNRSHNKMSNSIKQPALLVPTFSHHPDLSCAIPSLNCADHNDPNDRKIHHGKLETLAEHDSSVSPLLTDLTVHYIGRILAEQGFSHEGQLGSFNDIERSCKIDTDQTCLFHALLGMLENSSLIEVTRKRASDGRVLDDKASFVRILKDLPSSPEEPRKKLFRLREASNYTAEIRLIEICGASLENVLTGKKTGIDALFPIGATNALTDLYQHSPTCRTYLDILAGSVEHLLTNWQSARKCRILEIGGGTGAILTLLAPLIDKYQVEYTFTDVSSSFVRQARTRLRKMESIEFRTFDIDACHIAQELPSDSFDIVLANDVLHLSHDIESALTQLREILVPGGRLHFIELTKEPVWASLVFGLLRDWWHRNDDPRMPCSPCRHSDFWEQQLDSSGFTTCESVGLPRLPHTVITARSSKTSKYASPPLSAHSINHTLIFSSTDAYSRQLIDRLESRNKVIVQSGARYSNQYPLFEIRHDLFEDHANLLNELHQLSKMPQEVVVLWNFFANQTPSQPGEVIDSITSTLLAISNLLRAFNQYDSNPPKMTLVSSGAHQNSSATDIGSCLNAALWGIARTIRNEFPQTRCRMIDINPARPDLIPELCRFIADRSEVLEAVLGNSGWKLPIAMPMENQPPSRFSPKKIECLDPGNIASINSVPSEIPVLGDNEVLIEVATASLNFRDVMLALDALPDEAVQSGAMHRSLGMECAGRIIKTGRHVGTLSIGDRVVALAPKSMRTMVAASADFARPIPDNWTFEQVVGLPAAYITAVSCLDHLPTDKSDLSVLIHSASGGVGLALANLLNKTGATIYATAGSPDKTEFLNNVGVNCIASSRTTAFADEVLNQTDGKGVDMVINTLGGDQADANVQVLKPGGVYAELGKHQSRHRTHDAIRCRNAGASIHVIDIDKIWKDAPKHLSKVFHSVMSRIEDGAYPFLPHTAFSARNAAEAFRYVSDARHIGKVIVDFGADWRNFAPPISPEATYLVSGGTRGFGLATAIWLNDVGARHIIVIGRSPAKTARLEEFERDCEASGTSLAIVSADITDLDQLKTAIGEKSSKLPAIRGVFHCAMEIEDRTLTNLTDESCRTSLRTKITGAWNLHKLTEDSQLTFLALYSSVASLIGPSGQAAYSAANAFLDSFAQYLRTRRIPAISINWGAISDYGHFADNHGQSANYADRFRITPLPAASMLAPLEGILGLRDFRQLVVAAGRRFESPFNLEPDLTSSTDSNERTDKSKNNSCEPQSPDFEHIVLSCFSKVLEIPISSIEPNRSVLDLGIDSLLAVELSHLLRSEANMDISATELLNPVTIHDILRQCLSNSN